MIMQAQKKKSEIPPQTKWGIRVTVVVLLLIMIMIIKNCMGSFMYGDSTRQELQKQYYELGYSNGVRKAQGLAPVPEPETENLFLRKLYIKGYRDGWDSARENRQTEPDKLKPKQ